MRWGMPTLLLVVLAACKQAMPLDSLPAAPPVEPAGELSAGELPKRALRLGHPPNLTVKTSSEEFKPLAAYLGETLQHDVYVVVPQSYDDVVDLLVADKIDFALLTPFLYVRAKKRMPNVRLLASVLGEGASQYRGYIVTAADRPLHSLADLKGKRFAFVDKGSTSGYLFPLATLHDAGINAESDFKELVYAGSHRQVVDWVLSGRVDAGAISSTSFLHFRSEAISSRLFIIAKTDWIPFDAFVAHPSLPEPLVAKVKTALLSLDTRTAEGREILTGVTTNNGFVEARDEAYESVRRLASKLGLE